MKEFRDKIATIAFTYRELKFLDSVKDKHQLVSKRKVSRADVIIQALEFSNGKMPIKQ
jgi:hypothetical protein